MDAIELAYLKAREWVESLADRPVGAQASLEELRAALQFPLPQNGRAAEDVIEDLARGVVPGLHANPGPRFFAWVMGGSLPSALAADWLVSAWDQNAALYAVAPSAAIVEEVAGEWIKELLHLPMTCSFAFTTGCQLAHVTALAAARHAVLKDTNWNVERQGLFGAPSISIVSSDNRHSSIDRAIRFLGFGSDALREVATNRMGQIEPDSFEKGLKRIDGPRIVVLNAADLNTGTFDRFSELIPLAKAAGAWVHIDGAFGLFARASDTYRHLTDGIELADSWATDGHKWLNVPFDCGAVFIRDRNAHYAAMTQSASYIEAKADARNQIDWNLEWSRRARAMPIYAAIQELGSEGLESMIDRCCACCLALAEGIAALPNAELLAAPVLNQALVRFTKPNGTREDHDRFTEEVMAAVNESGVAYFSPTVWNGQRAMRISVVNWRTTQDDVVRTLAAVETALARQTEVA